ncbi:hypothetical protein ACIQNU_27920 [Streptomyces sp. NPDC091292]|uniref:hypothetical protein n=1 Tax=Streptomyces sp. NPDC091292 TaxID=3365991 RepID=UPI0037F6EAFE
MGTFLETVAAFPTVMFSAALAVVIGFWVLVAVGLSGTDSFDSDADLGSWGLGGVPVTVAFSLITVLGWFTSLTATVLLAPVVPSGGALRSLVHLLVLTGALLVAWRVTRWLVRPLATLFPEETGPSRQDFVGRICTIRTGRVDSRFGQAEVAARDGSTAVVQVRLSAPDAAVAAVEGDGGLGYGGAGLLYAYDEPGEFFWVAPYDAALAPGDPEPEPGRNRDRDREPGRKRSRPRP